MDGAFSRYLFFVALAFSAAACSSEADSNGTNSSPATPDGSTAGAGGSNAAGANASSGGVNQGGNIVGAGGTITSGAGTAGTGSGTTHSGGATNGGATASSGGHPGAGGQSSGSGGGSGNLPDGGCLPGVGTACDPNRSICCGGFICVASTSTDYSGCRQPCTTAADCASGCCIPFANLPDKGFCGDAKLCQCAGEGETCGGTRQCCGGQSCSTFDSTGALACHKLCTQNSDCTTNCCVKVNGTSDSVCLPAKPWCGA
jgi:hypothetical protein